jgi:catechol 2,3-dioxygenase-like lactoylglutathione lyase family enzyme
MNRYTLAFHHLGLAVRAPDKARAFLAGLGYAADPVKYDPAQGVNLVMCRCESMPDVELIFPADGPGPLDAIFKRAGEGIYHCCYVAPDTKAAVAMMKKDGVKLVQVSPSKPALQFQGYSASFYYIDGFGMIEILEPAQQGKDGERRGDD